MKNYGVTDKGFVVRTSLDILQEATNKIKAKYPDAVIPDDSIEGNYLILVSDMLTQVWEVLQECYNAGFIQFAENAALDFLMALNNKTRLAASNSLLRSVVLTGTPGTIVNTGFRAQASSNVTSVWQTTSLAVVPPSGELVVDMQCTVLGAVSLDAHTLDTILTPVTGIETIDNPFEATLGREAENDANFLARRNNQIATSIGGSHAGISNSVASLNEIEGQIIDFIKIVSNRTDVIDAANRPPHSFEAIISDTALYSTLPFAGSIEHNTLIITIESYDVTSILSAGSIIAIESDYNSFYKEKFTVRAVSFDGTDSTIVLNSAYKGTTIVDAALHTVSSKDKDIASLIWRGQSGGIDSYGISNIDILDMNGNTQIVSFSHPAPVDIYLDLALTSNAPLSSNEIDEIKQDIVTWGNTLGIGQKVVIYGFNCLVAQFKNPKITNVTIQAGYWDGSTVVWVGDNNVPVSDGTTKEVQYSRWSTANIVVI